MGDDPDVDGDRAAPRDRPDSIDLRKEQEGRRGRRERDYSGDGDLGRSPRLAEKDSRKDYFREGPTGAACSAVRRNPRRLLRKLNHHPSLHPNDRETIYKFLQETDEDDNYSDIDEYDPDD